VSGIREMAEMEIATGTSGLARQTALLGLDENQFTKNFIFERNRGSVYWFGLIFVKLISKSLRHQKKGN
jgi:hypothetical protein